MGGLAQVGALSLIPARNARSDGVAWVFGTDLREAVGRPTLRDVIRHYYPGVLHVARELFAELRQYSGSTAFGDVLVPWTEKRGQMIVELLAPLARYG